jgi:hypothetical protein
MPAANPIVVKLSALTRTLPVMDDTDDASPGRFLPEKRVQIEHFIDQLLAVLAGRLG